MFAALNAFLTRSAAGYFINKSLRFRSSASAYLNRTAGTPTAQTKYTISVWVKRGTSTYYSVFSAGSAALNDYDSVQFNSASTLAFFTGPGAGSADLVTTQLFRDYAAWYHIIVAVDTTQATASNRVKFYVNGTQVTSFTSSTYPSLNGASAINRSGAVQAIGALYSGSYNQYFDGEMAEFNFIDGQQVDPTALGAFSIYNQWLPVKYAGTYGTNGFYLPFSNTTSTSTLVADSSGNGNNWTPNNISLTAGSTYDSLTDVPTLTSATAANYAVLNPLQIGGTTISPTPIALTNGNLAWSYNRTSSGAGWISATISIPSTGKWYFEYVATGGSPVAYSEPGVMDIATPKSQAQPSIFRSYYGYDGTKNSNGVYSAYGAAAVINDILSVAIDMDNGALYFGKNGTWLNSGVPTSGVSRTGAAFTDLLSTGVTWMPMMGVMGNNAATGYTNFGQQPWQASIPTGYFALNTFNI